jgi:hypothetical protein
VTAAVSSDVDEILTDTTDGPLAEPVRPAGLERATLELSDETEAVEDTQPLKDSDLAAEDREETTSEEASSEEVTSEEATEESDVEEPLTGIDDDAASADDSGDGDQSGTEGDEREPAGSTETSSADDGKSGEAGSDE